MFGHVTRQQSHQSRFSSSLISCCVRVAVVMPCDYNHLSCWICSKCEFLGEEKSVWKANTVVRANREEGGEGHKETSRVKTGQM